MGDVRLAAVIGILATGTDWETLLLAALLPYLLALPFALWQQRRLRQDAGGNRHLPFGPFPAAGAVAAAIITGCPRCRRPVPTLPAPVDHWPGSPLNMTPVSSTPATWWQPNTS
jgi:hypothetical protein